MLDIVKLSSLNNVSTWHPQRIKQSLMKIPFISSIVSHKGSQDFGEGHDKNRKYDTLYPKITYKIQYIN